MRNWGKAPQMLVALNCVCFSVAHADDAAPVTTPVASTVTPAPEAPTTTTAAPTPEAPTATARCLLLQRRRLLKHQHRRVQVQQ